jgi:putative oxidoreductase
MAVAYFKAHASHGLSPVVNRGELAVLYCFVFLYLAVAGGGPWSVGHCCCRAKPGDSTGGVTNDGPPPPT